MGPGSTKVSQVSIQEWALARDTMACFFGWGGGGGGGITHTHTSRTLRNNNIIIIYLNDNLLGA